MCSFAHWAHQKSCPGTSALMMKPGLGHGREGLYWEEPPKCSIRALREYIIQGQIWTLDKKGSQRSTTKEQKDQAWFLKGAWDHRWENKPQGRILRGLGTWNVRWEGEQRDQGSPSLCNWVQAVSKMSSLWADRSPGSWDIDYKGRENRMGQAPVKSHI